MAAMHPASEGALSDVDRERQERMAANAAKMQELGLLKQASILASFKVVKPLQQKAKPCGYKRQAPKQRLPPRRSKRLLGEKVDLREIDSDDEVVGERGAYASPDDEPELIDLMDRNGKVVAPAEPTQHEAAVMQEIRCASQGRGSIYDSSVGITCHFCRQKKLCGEEGCPRCTSRNTALECIGKTSCSRCGTATGQFCRACLLIRYGQELDEVRAAGAYVCAHCYAEEHPEEGWFCNSSFCMKRQGMKPTGIAIYEANARGFKSVAHYLQAQWKARNGGSAAGMEVDGDTKAEGTAKAEEVELGGSASSAASKTCVQAESPQPSGEQSALASKRPSAAVASSRLVLAKERKRLVAL